MKKLLIGFILVVCIFSSRSQSNDTKRGFYDCKLSYDLSLKEIENPGHNDWGINTPIGIGISSTYRFSNSFFAEIEFAYKSAFIKKEYFTFNNQMSLAHEYQYNSIEIPIQLHYHFLKYKAMHLYACAGLKGSFSMYHDNWDPYFNETDVKSNTHEYRIAYSLGLLETFELSKNIGIFASQNFAHYFANKAKASTFIYTASDVFFENMADFRVGLSYKI